jgi:hypothetical protein
MSDLQPVTTAIEFFSEKELACKGTGVIKLDPRFAVALPELRRAWGKSLSPNSICRTPEHNAKVGGNPNSLHMTENAKWPTLGTMAADISWRGWPVEEQLALLVWLGAWVGRLACTMVSATLTAVLILAWMACRSQCSCTAKTGLVSLAETRSWRKISQRGTLCITKLQLTRCKRERAQLTSAEGTWFDMDKVRFRSGMPEKIGGWVRIPGTLRHPSTT